MVDVCCNTRPMNYGAALLPICIRKCVAVTSLLSLFTALPAGAQSPVTLLIENGKIWTGNPNQPEAEAVAVAGNRIVAVGTTDALRSKYDGTPNIDLDGRRMLPGFNDAHVHFYAGGANLTGPQLRHSKSQAEFRATRAYSQTVNRKADGSRAGTGITRIGLRHNCRAVN